MASLVAVICDECDIEFNFLVLTIVPITSGLFHLSNDRKKCRNIMVYHNCLLAASILPIEDIVQWAHDVQAKVLVDACQSVPHMVVDVKALDVDFLVASSHKVRFLPLH